MVELSRKLKCLLLPGERYDSKLMRELVRGSVVTERLHPLIFEASVEGESETVQFRSIQFFEQLVADAADGISDKYQSLSAKQKRIVGVGVRDLFLASSSRLLGEREKRIFQDMVGILDEAEGCIQVEGMDVSFYPTAGHKVAKFLEIPDELLEGDLGSLFARITHTPNLRVVFVDPAELSFHNFENIVPLDPWIEPRLSEASDRESLLLSDIHQLKAGREVWTGKLQGAASDLIKQLPSLDPLRVRKAYDESCDYARKKLYEAPLLFLNQRLVINRSNIKTVGDKMYFLKGTDPDYSSIPPINFEACWNDFSVDEYIHVSKEICAPQLLISPLLFHRFEEGYHFVLDFFRNDWMVQVDDKKKVYTPIISNDGPDIAPEESLFWPNVRSQSPA